MTALTELPFRARSAQAMIELALGLFALALVISALCVFSAYIVRSLEMENSLRGNSKGVADSVETGAFAAEHLFGAEKLHISEPRGEFNREIW